MRAAYLDCSSGISGDMVIGAFVDLGLSLSKLKAELKKLKVGSFDLKAKKVKRGHISVTKIDVINGSKKRFNDLSSMNKVIDNSKLDKQSKEKIKQVFLALARAEAKAHKQTLDKVHFHHLGELDTIIDIAGCVLGLKLLNIEQVYASPVVSGVGTLRLGKYVFPIPGPATVELLRNRTIRIDHNITHETVTPTGAAILSALSKEIMIVPAFSIEKAGYGAGTYKSDYLPNCLRVMIGELRDKKPDAESIMVVETNIDDTPGLNFEVLFERLFKLGALDVFTSPILMKKQRPGLLLQVQTEEKDLEKVIAAVFEETSTIGLRINKVGRRKLNRKILKLKTDYGIIVRVKLAYLGGQVINIAPEYEDCKKIARKKTLPFKIVHERIKAQAIKKFGDNGF